MSRPSRRPDCFPRGHVMVWAGPEAVAGSGVGGAAGAAASREEAGGRAGAAAEQRVPGERPGERPPP